MLALSLPLLAIVNGLPTSVLSAVIIGIGMRQAWRMNVPAVVDVAGPYRVAPLQEPA